MAINPKTGLEEEGQVGAYAPTAPTISAPGVGSTASVGGTTAGNSPIAQSTSPAGTGFVNIDRVLAANAGAGNAVAQRMNNATSSEAGDFNKASSDFGNIKKTAKDQPKYSAVYNSLVNPSSPDAAKEISAARSAINAGYGGPESFGHTQNKEFTDASKLGDTRTTGEQLAAGNNRGLYNAGLAALDRVIYGNTPGIKAAAENAGQQKAFEGKISQNLTESIPGLKDLISGNAASLKDQLRNQATKLYGTDKYGNRALLNRIGQVLGDSSLMNIAAAPPPPPPNPAQTKPTAPVQALAPSGYQKAEDALRPNVSHNIYTPLPGQVPKVTELDDTGTPYPERDANGRLIASPSRPLKRLL